MYILFCVATTRFLSALFDIQMSTLHGDFRLHGRIKCTYNKRPMGHIAHLRKPVQIINTNDYIIMLIMPNLVEISPVVPLGKGWGPSFEQT